MAEVRPGDVIADKYRVERMLGAGGMGYVVAAKHLQLRELVALKFVRQGALADDEAVARFIREARASAKLKGEHVVRVYDVGTLPTGTPYMVMEYLDGCDLAALTKRRGPMPLEEAADYILQACDALGEAHALGVVHRDVKLANLFLTQGPGGTPLIKVLDFGISKGNPFEVDLGMTTTSSMLGSPRFMSPEQMRDPRNVDARTDVWSLGIVLYRLIAGVLPFDADALGMLFQRVMHEPHRPVRHYRPDLPEAVGSIVDRCLEKDPSRRFQNVAELAQALVPFSLMPARSQALAERIAMTLKVPPGSMAIPAPLQSHPAPPLPSNRPNETGPTGAPWSETRHSVVPPRARTPLVVAGAALVAMAVVGGTVAWRAWALRDVHPQPVTAAPPPQTAITALPTTQDTPESTATPTAPIPAPVQTAAADPKPTAVAGTTPAPTATSRKQTGGARRTQKSGGDAASPSTATPTSTSKPETGIPTTRD
jgi:serine/threonine-protein kinase